MANRSYLYNIDFNRFERNKTQDDVMSGVAEYAYEIPISFKVLLSSNPINTKSIIWDYEHPITIIGEASKGKIRLLDFLNDLRNKNLFDTEYFEQELIKTEKFFKENPCELKYFFLEAGELYQMESIAIEEQNSNIYDEVKSINNTIEGFYKSIRELDKEISKLNELKNKKAKKGWFGKPEFVKDEKARAKIVKEIEYKRNQKKTLLGIDNWSTILYYHFKN